MNDDLRDRAEQLEDAVGDGGGSVRVITVGGDADRGGVTVLDTEAYRERFGEDPPGRNGPTVEIVGSSDEREGLDR